MAGEVLVDVIGTTTGAAELRFVPSGAAVANWTIAVNPRRFDKQTNEWKEQPAQFYRCSAWRDMAEHVAETLTRSGIRVMVSGTLNPREYEKDGVKRIALEIEVNEVGPSLRFNSVAVPEKSERGSGGGSRPSSSPQQPASDPWATGDSYGDSAPF